MKIKHFVAALSLLLAIGLGHWQCKLPIVEDCSLRVGIKVTPTSDPAVFEFRDTVGTTGPQTTYQWVLGDGNLSDKAVPRHTYTSGTYEVVLTVSEPGGCTATAQISLPVKTDGPQADFSFKLIPASGEVPCTVRFYNTSKNGETFAWDFGDLTQTNDTSDRWDSVDWTYTRASTYKVMLTVGKIGYSPSSKMAEVVVRAPTFTMPFTLSNGGQQQKVVGIDQNGTGGYFAAVCDGKLVFFVTANEKGVVSNLAPFAITPNTYTGVAVNNFRKVSSAYVLPCEASSTKVASFAFKASALTFDFQRKKDLGTGIKDIFNDVALTDKGDLLFCGSASDHPQPDSNGMYFVNANFGTLDKIWRKTLFSNQQGAEARCILNYENGYLVAGTARQLSGAFQACFFRMDDDLKIVGSPAFWNAFNFKIDDIILIAAGQYALVGNDGAIGRIRLVDTMGNNLGSKDKLYNGLKINQVVFTSNQRLVGAGLTSVNGQERACWFEIDPATLELKGSIQPLPMSTGATSAEATCIAPTTDGGFVLGGFSRSGSSTSNLIFKTDSNGKIQ